MDTPKITEFKEGDTLLIDITEEDIKNGNGLQCRASHCPVALAIRRIVDNDKCAYVGVTQSYINLLFQGRFKTNDKLKQFIKQFDNKEKVQPCQISLVLEKYNGF